MSDAEQLKKYLEENYPIGKILGTVQLIVKQHDPEDEWGAQIQIGFSHTAEHAHWYGIEMDGTGSIIVNDLEEMLAELNPQVRRARLEREIASKQEELKALIASM